MLKNEELEKQISSFKEKSSIYKSGRRFYTYKLFKDGLSYSSEVHFAQVVWNLYNPNNKIVYNDGYVIHHKDEDFTNDCITNLQKLTREEHARLHHSGEKSYNYGKFGLEHNRGGFKQTISHRNRISKALKGRVFKPETLKRMSESKQGSKNNRFGVKLSDETKHKISLGNLGKKLSVEHRKKLSELKQGSKHNMFGKKHSEETKLKNVVSSKE